MGCNPNRYSGLKKYQLVAGSPEQGTVSVWTSRSDVVGVCLYVYVVALPLQLQTGIMLYKDI